MNDGDELRRQFNSRGKKGLGLMFMRPLATQRYLLNSLCFFGRMNGKINLNLHFKRNLLTHLTLSVPV